MTHQKPSFKIAVLLAGTLAFALSACSPAKSKRSDNQVVGVVGDPMTMVKGTLMTTEGIPKAFFVDGDSVSITTTQFKEGNVATDTAAVLDSQKAKTNSTPESQQSDMKTKKLVSGEWSITGVSEGKPVTIDFEDGGDETLKFKKIEWEGQDLGSTDNFELLHTSHNLDKGVISLLFYYGAPGKRNILAIYIMGKPQRREDFPGGSSNDDYFYMFGRGFKMGWIQTEEVSVKICGERPDALKKTASESVDRWQTELKGRLTLKSESVVICPPFSDVNTRTLTYVDQWLELADRQWANLGETHVSGRISTSSLVDADVFIFLSEFAKLGVQEARFSDPEFYNDPKVVAKFKRTSVHELGHLLGLNHPEKGTNSIMAYSDVDDIQEYDRSAIQALYPVQK